MITEDHRKTFKTYSMKQKLAMPSLANINISLIVLTLCIIGTTYHLNSLYKKSLMGADTAVYISVAKNILKGKGFSTSIIYYDEDRLTGKIPAPETVFPNGYPFLISLVMMLGVSPAYSAFIICIVCFNLIGIELYLISKKFNYSNILYIFIIVSWFFSTYIWYYVLSCLSELSFIFFTTTSTYLLLLNELKNSKIYVFYSSIAAALSYTIRYVGIFFILSLIIYFIYKYLKNRNRDSSTNIMIISLIPTVSVVATILRNYLVVGSIRGSSRYLPESTITDTIYGIYSAFCGFSGFSKKALFSFNIPSLLIAISVFIFIFLLSIFIRNGFKEKLFVHNNTPRILFIKFLFIYIMVTFVILTYFNIKSIEPIEKRYLVPLVPMITIIIAEIFHSLRKYKIISTKKLFIGIYFIIFAFLSGQTNVYSTIEKRKKNNYFNIIYEALKGPDTSENLKVFINEIIKNEKIVLGNATEYLGNILNVPVIGLTSRTYHKGNWSFREVHYTIRKFKIEYVIFFPKLFNLTKNDNLFYYELKMHNTPIWLKKEYGDNNVVLFKVEDIIK